jgi:hypothetical protein
MELFGEVSESGSGAKPRHSTRHTVLFQPLRHSDTPSISTKHAENPFRYPMQPHLKSPSDQPSTTTFPEHPAYPTPNSISIVIPHTSLQSIKPKSGEPATLLDLVRYSKSRHAPSEPNKVHRNQLAPTGPGTASRYIAA